MEEQDLKTPEEINADEEADRKLDEQMRRTAEQAQKICKQITWGITAVVLAIVIIGLAVILSSR